MRVSEIFVLEYCNVYVFIRNMHKSELIFLNTFLVLFSCMFNIKRAGDFCSLQQKPWPLRPES